MIVMVFEEPHWGKVDTFSKPLLTTVIIICLVDSFYAEDLISDETSFSRKFLRGHDTLRASRFDVPSVLSRQSTASLSLQPTRLA